MIADRQISYPMGTLRRLSAATRMLVLATGLTAFAGGAIATTITNNDDKEHTITLIEGDKERQVVLKPEQRIENLCPTGCRLRLPDDDEDYELEAKDVVVIEEGYLYYDDPNQPETAPGPGQQPPAAAPPAATPPAPKG